MLTTLREALTAYYDGNTDQIYNCREGTFIWHHENRHRWQHKKLNLIRYVTLAMVFSLVTTVGLQDWRYSLIGFIALMVPEIDAWFYSIWLYTFGKYYKH